MARLKNALGFAMVCAFLPLAFVCWSQTVPAPVLNTAGAGVRAADVEAAVGALCRAQDITRSKNGGVSGCRVCPQGTDFYGDKNSAWEMDAATPGHFTSPAENNLLLDGTGCDSHANNYGGSFMFALKSPKPQLLKYDQGLVTSQCHRFAYPDGRDFLICQGGWSGQGLNSENIFMSGFDAAGKDTSTRLITTTDMTGTCGDDPAQVVQESSIKEIKFSPVNSEKITAITVTATLGNVKCSQAAIDAKTQKPASSVKAYEVEFLFDGRHFKTAPTSKAALNRFESN